MIDLSSDTLLTFPQAAKYLPGNRHISSLHRWRLRGVRGHKLETILVGGRRYTSVAAIEIFIAATTAAANGEQPSARSPRQRQCAIEQAERALSAYGI